MIGRGPDEVAFPRGVGQVVKTNTVPDEKDLGNKTYSNVSVIFGRIC